MPPPPSSYTGQELDFDELRIHDGDDEEDTTKAEQDAQGRGKSPDSTQKN